MYKYYKMLSNNELRILFSQSISTVGDFMALPAFLILAFERGEKIVSLFLIIYFLPRFIQPLLGIVADKFDLKKIILFTEILRCFLFIILFFYPSNSSTVIWLAIAGLNSLIGSIFDPARLKLMMILANDFSKYNSIFNLFYSFTGLFSIILSIFIEIKFTTEVVFLLNAITFFISFLILFFMNFKISGQLEKPKMKDLLGGFSFFKNVKIIQLLIIIIFIDFFTGIFYEYFPRKSIEIGIDNYGTYVFSALICLGNSIGAYLIYVVSKQLLLLVPLISVLTFSVFLFFNCSSYLISFIACFLFFTVQMTAIGVSEVFIGKNIPKKFHGRVFAINESFPIIAMMVGSFYSNIVSKNILFFIAVLLFIVALTVTNMQTKIGVDG